MPRKLQEKVHVQHRGPESCKTKLTCNILPLDVARQSPRATYCPRMLQDEAHVQHIAPGCCKRMSTCNIAPPKVAREDRRATYCLRKLQENVDVQHIAPGCCKRKPTCNIEHFLSLDFWIKVNYHLSTYKKTAKILII